MKKLFISLIIIFIFYTPLFSSDEWTTQDTILQLSVIALTTYDLMQTYTFLYTEPYISEGHKEMNPLMGPHPSKSRFYAVGIGFIAFHSFVSYVLPYKLRTIWQLMYINFEANMIYHNYQCGVRVKF